MTQEITKLTIENNSLQSVKGQLSALGEEEVRIQVLFTAINTNDLLLLEGKHRNDYFGTGTVGKVVLAGKKVGHVKVGDIVGVYHNNLNTGEFKTGFSTYIQVHQHQALYVPNTIAPEQAASIIADGVIAFNVISKIEHNSNVAVIGTGSLAYFVTQYAQKVANSKVTIFGYEGGEQLAKQWSADGFIPLSGESFQKNTQKFDSAIVAGLVKEEDSQNILNLPIRNGIVYYAINMGFNPNVTVLELITSQKGFVGVKRGDYGQAVLALKAAAYHQIVGRVETVQWANFEAGFEKAKNCGYSSVVLKY